MNCELDFFSFQTNPPNFNVPQHKHNCFELVYYIDGYGSTSLNDKNHSFSNNTFSIITPHTYHTETSIKESDLIYFGFKYDNIPIQLQNGVFNDSSDKVILKLLKKMKYEILTRNLHYKVKLDFLICEILIELDRLYSTKKTDEESTFSYIINFINENYNTQIDLHNLANLSCLSYHRFRHLFKEITGFAPTKFILHTRLKNSKNMLKNSNASITNIALNCGFSNASQFSTLFKETYGMTPRNYRNSKIKSLQ